MFDLLQVCAGFSSSKKFSAMTAKRESIEGLSSEVGAGHPVVVSVLIPGEDSKKYLLAKYGDRGWWLPYGKVHKHEAIKTAAQRVAAEVSVIARVTQEWGEM